MAAVSFLLLEAQGEFFSDLYPENLEGFLEEELRKVWGAVSVGPGLSLGALMSAGALLGGAGNFGRQGQVGGGGVTEDVALKVHFFLTLAFLLFLTASWSPGARLALPRPPLHRTLGHHRPRHRVP